MQSVQGFVASQFFEACVLITSVCISWIILSLLSATLDLCTSDVKRSVPKAKGVDAFSGVNVDLDDASTQADDSDADLTDESDADDSDRALEVSPRSKLFEHYGLFGASPAAWCQNRVLDAAEEADDETDGKKDAEAVACNDQMRVVLEVVEREEECGVDACRGVSLSASTLFEHYGLFGACPGTWAGKT